MSRKPTVNVHGNKGIVTFDQKGNNTINQYIRVERDDGVVLRPETGNEGCAIDEYLSVIAGDNLFIAKKLPYTLIYIDTKPVFVIDRIDGGLVIKTLRIFDDRQDLIIRIENGKLWRHINTRPGIMTPSSIEMFDHNDDMVLRIKYLNHCTLSVEAVFRNRGLGVTIGNEWISLSNGMRTSGARFENMAIFITPTESGFAPIATDPKLQ